jgi:hypothetical protein
VAPGSYQLGLAGVPPPDNNCVVNVTLRTAFAKPVMIATGVILGGVVQVVFFSTDDATTIDGDFYITVTDDR